MDATILRLARYVHQLSFEQLPEQAVHEARRRLIDSVACAAAASTEPFCRNLAAFARRYSGTPGARLWGSGEYTSLEMAAFANGAMVRYLDFSDTVLLRSAGHPSDMLPALVGVAESRNKSGADLLTAIVAAYEVYCSLCAAVPMSGRGIDQSTAAAVGAAAGAGYLVGLPTDLLAHALSLALVANLHLYNVRAGALSDWKGCAGPNGARNGVFAALLAHDGITGPSAPVEGKGGFHEIVGDFDWQPGSVSLPLITQTHLKRHPVCYHGQSAVDAVLVLREKVNADQIERIDIDTYEAAFNAMAAGPERWAPVNRETADHSLPYASAVAWREGRLGMDAYDESHLRDERTRDLMQRISVRPDPDLTAAFPAKAQTRMVVRTHDGVTHTHFQDNPRGNAANPMRDSELESKFIELFAPWGDEAVAQRVLERLWGVTDIPHVNELVDMLCAGSAEPV